MAVGYQACSHMEMEQLHNPLPRFFIVIGLLFVLMGVLWLLLEGKMGWLGRLPGDIRIERPHVRIYFPLTTMLILSVVLSIVLSLIRRFFS